MVKGIIFDFDGVVVESVQVKTEAFAALYDSYGEQLVTKVVQHHLENGGMSRFEKFKIYHELFLNVKLSNSELLDLSNKFSKLVVQKVIGADYV